MKVGKESMRLRFASRGFAVVLAIVTLLGVGAVSAIGFHAAHASAGSPGALSAATSYQATRGQLRYVGQVTANTLSHGALAKPSAHSIPLRTPHSSAAHMAASSLHAPQVSSAPMAAAGGLIRSFNGVDAIQSQAVQPNSIDVEPPDEGLAAGNGYVFNLVNLAGIIYHSNGTVVAGPFSLSAFFNEPPAFSTVLISDPRVFFDSSTNRWFATELEFNLATGTESHLDIAVSTSGNPAGSYNLYQIDTTDPSGYECPCFSDYPILGIDQFNLYISGNEFSIAGSAFNGAEIFAISKAQLEAGATTANFVRFGSLNIGGTTAYHVQPAISYGLAPAEFFLNSLDPNSTFDDRLGVWAMTNRESVTTGVGMPQLSSTVIKSETYGFPPNAVTPPGFNAGIGAATTGVVATDFDAMEEVEYINGHLDSALNTAVTIAGDTSERAGIAWFQVDPVLSGKVISGSSHVIMQGYFARRGLYLLYPHVNETPDGNMAMVFGLGGPSTYLSAAYAVMLNGSTGFGSLRVAGAGTGPDNGFTATAGFGGVGRWGDYSNGEILPGTNQVWLATQYIPNNGDQFANWGDRIFEVQL